MPPISSIEEWWTVTACLNTTCDHGSRHPTPAAHLLNQKNGELSSPAVSGDGWSSQVLVSVKSLWPSASSCSLSGRAKSFFFLVWKQIGLWLFLHDSIKSEQSWFLFHENSCVLQWINLNSSLFYRKWSEFYIEGFYWQLNHLNLEENSYLNFYLWVKWSEVLEKSFCI